MGEFIGNNLDIFYWFTILMFSVATCVIIAFEIIGMITNHKNSKKTLLSIGGLLAVLALAYFGFSSDEVFDSYAQYGITNSTSKFVGMGLWSFYILLFVAVISIIVTGTLNRINNK